MEFENNFFKNEVRNGFFVSSLMKRAWAANMEVLNDIDNICRENGIKYYVGYGTLLGAIRHGGFIPWDDDIDVWMFREDYEKFRDFAKAGKLPYQYILNSITTKDYYEVGFDHICSSEYLISFSDEQMTKFHGFPFLCGVDIYPLDYLPDNRVEEYKENTGTLVDVIFNIYNFKKELNPRLKELLEKKYSCRIDKNKNVLNQLYKIYEKQISTNTEGKKVAYVLEWNMKDYKKEFNREWFDKVEYVKFEQIKVPVPAGYDGILRSLYSDYQQAVRSGDNHDYPFFKKRQSFVDEVSEVKIAGYDVEKYNLEELKKKRQPIDRKEIIRNQLICLNNLTEEINKVVLREETIEFENLLEYSQELAIRIGEYIEERYSDKETNRIVECLENYCEKLYELSFSGIDFKSNILKEAMDSVKDAIEKAELVKETGIIKLLFIFENKNDWNWYEPIFEAFSGDEKIKCLIMQIPYYLLNDKLKADESEPVYDNIEIMHPENLVDYRYFDFSKEKVDCIIKSNPYDEYSFGDVIHPFFYTNNLKKYCNMIIHIPTLDIDDFTIEDMQMKEMAEYFVKTPGVVNSDYVLLNSKNKRDSYISILNEISKKIPWEDKVGYFEDENSLVRIIKEKLFSN